MTSILLLEQKHIRKSSKHRGEMVKQRKEHRIKRLGPMRGHGWLQRLFLLCLHPSLSLFIACCVKSEWCFACLQPGGKTELQSQATNDERHPGMLCAWTKSSKQEKMLCFQQHFFPATFLTFCFFGVGFSIMRASIFSLFFFMALAPQL